MGNQKKKAVVNNILFTVNATPLSATGEGEGAVDNSPMSATGDGGAVDDSPLSPPSVTDAPLSVVELATPNVRPSESTDPNSVISQSALHAGRGISKPQAQPYVLKMS